MELETPPPPIEPAAAARPRDTYWLSRALFLRLFGLVYFAAFLALERQLLPLLGKRGVLPAEVFLRQVAEGRGAGWPSFSLLPSIFWINASDGFMHVTAVLGLALSLVVAAGYGNAIVMILLWAIYQSFVHVGQIFFGYGWEILLLETGFLAIFLCPLWRGHPFPARSPPSFVVIVLFRWLLFRMMLGAGLIKIRGDACWRDLTCLLYHYETQPLPNPISWLLHQSPPWFHKLEVVWTHFTEIVVPFTLFGPRRLRTVGALLTIALQVTLIVSGNLSFLNYLTIALCIPCLDDRLLARFAPARLHDKLTILRDIAEPPTRGQKLVVGALAILVGVLSIRPALNLLSSEQVMNRSYDPLDLVNTYGMFGSVGRERPEVVLEGTDNDPAHPKARWQEYDFPCKPGDPARRPCFIAPFQYRLDWQIWFAAMSDYRRNPWLVSLVAKLLEGDRDVRRLLAPGPFEDHPPRAIRARLYDYRFTRRGEPGWWRRTLRGEYLPPLTRDDPSLRAFLRRYGLGEAL